MIGPSVNDVTTKAVVEHLESPLPLVLQGRVFFWGLTLLFDVMGFRTRYPKDGTLAYGTSPAGGVREAAEAGRPL